MSERPIPGRSYVSKRAIVEVVRAAVVESYGVTGLADPDLGSRLLRWLHLRTSGIRLHLSHGMGVELFLTVAYGVPIAEVARQVDSAVRYGLRRAMGLEVDQLVIHVGGLRYQPAHSPLAAAATPESAPRVDVDVLPGEATGREAEHVVEAGGEVVGGSGDGPAKAEVPG
ncbi:MAG: Asp23/Gls24 family envelope stress response protein [Chloroflexota bacterium]